MLSKPVLQTQIHCPCTNISACDFRRGVAEIKYRVQSFHNSKTISFSIGNKGKELRHLVSQKLITNQEAFYAPPRYRMCFWLTQEIVKQFRTFGLAEMSGPNPGSTARIRFRLVRLAGGVNKKDLDF